VSRRSEEWHGSGYVTSRVREGRSNGYPGRIENIKKGLDNNLILKYNNIRIRKGYGNE
jgi:hypothetical protein